MPSTGGVGERKVKMASEKTADLDYKGYYHKHQEEIACLKMKLMDSEEHNRMLREEVARLSAIKATVEVIFGRKFDGK
jgi:hypothetical protein